MFRQSRYLYVLLGLLVAFGLHQASAETQDPPEPITLTALQESYEGADIQLCGCDVACGGCSRGGLLGSLLSSCRCRSACDPCGPCGDCGSGGCDGGCGNGCGGNGACTPWSVYLWSGPTYYSMAFESLWGFAEGATVGYRMTDTVGLYGSVGFNHTDRSTTLLGTVGVQKFGIPYAGTLLDRTSLSIMFDQFADFDIGPDAYFHQFRFNVGYVTAPRREIGMTFSVPTSDDLGVAALSPLGGAGVMSTGNSFVGPYWMAELDNGMRLTTTVGYSDGGEGGVAVGVDASVPFTANTDLFVSGKFAGPDAYTTMVGVQLRGGRADTRSYR